MLLFCCCCTISYLNVVVVLLMGVVDLNINYLVVRIKIAKPTAAVLCGNHQVEKAKTITV